MPPRPTYAAVLSRPPSPVGMDMTESTMSTHIHPTPPPRPRQTPQPPPQDSMVDEDIPSIHPSIHPTATQAPKRHLPPPHTSTRKRRMATPATAAIRKYQEDHPEMGLPMLRVNLPASAIGRIPALQQHLAEIWPLPNSPHHPYQPPAVAQISSHPAYVGVNVRTLADLIDLTASPLPYGGTVHHWHSSSGQ
ncbi:hypothetical protein IWQ62_001648, partial [Dispira parvispora]